MDTASAEPRTLRDLPPAEFRRWLRQQNPTAAICPRCRWPFLDGDGGDFNPRLCLSCETRILYRLVGRLLKARGRQAVLEAAREIRRMAKP